MNGTAEQHAIAVARALVMDAVQQAGNGHPGAAISLAPTAYALWTHTLRFDPDHPDWPNRDRFVLSNGHASALLYSVLHLTGYDLGMGDLKQLRQFGSRTPAHPEYRLTVGVDTTTGPLGQGVATAVGMAIGERYLEQQFAGYPGLVDFRTWSIVGDGCLEEGLSSEACSLAGHLGLGKLNVIYDDNEISIDGETNLAFSEDVRERFESYGWQVLEVADGNDGEALRASFDVAKAEVQRPSLIIVRTAIAYGAPKLQGSAATHGSPLGAEEIRGAKQFYGLDPDQDFAVSDEDYQQWRAAVDSHRAEYQDWLEIERQMLDGGRKDAAMWQRLRDQSTPDGALDAVRQAGAALSGDYPVRQMSGFVLQTVADRFSEVIGGSADLTGPTNSQIDGAEVFTREHAGRQIHFGIREHVMAAAGNGLALLGLRPFVATFLAFSDYQRPAIRLAALMGLPTTFVLTHDAITATGDGPTHQPVEQLISLRAMPNINVWRPGTGAEVGAAWASALEQAVTPTALCLSRSTVLAEVGSDKADDAARGGYVLSEAAAGKPEAVIIATGSEIGISLEAQRMLAEQGVNARVVSLPCWEVFEQQDVAYKDGVLPGGIPRVSVEAGSALGWCRYVAPNGSSVAIDTFGACGQGDDVMAHFGFTAANVADHVLTALR
ncbi:transketolase [Propionimicrobium sp. PCR01-08-3]|uniref:transketolase n=1 Tax=Propionimicrobium sp. PCR01-08-3 TaxID=3052086 RepID=UPI00255C7974|nr:transketolase [Propionimicrobium sp. PCR01-08-3]WIY83487.1 transketolase [Propionimicrobium sp. PCR01-08-3]